MFGTTGNLSPKHEIPISSRILFYLFFLHKNNKLIKSKQEGEKCNMKCPSFYCFVSGLFLCFVLWNAWSADVWMWRRRLRRSKLQWFVAIKNYDCWYRKRFFDVIYFMLNLNLSFSEWKVASQLDQRFSNSWPSHRVQFMPFASSVTHVNLR